MIDFAALQDFVYSERVYDSEVHGLDHWRQVEFDGLLLAPRTGADVTVVRLFALFHDSKRWDDGYDEEHGLRGAEFAKECFEKKMLDISREQFDQLYQACRFHTVLRNTGIATIDTCFDADRLDLGRVGFKLNPQKMATEWGAKIARMSLTSGVSVFKMREWLKTVKL